MKKNVLSLAVLALAFVFGACNPKEKTDNEVAANSSVEKQISGSPILTAEQQAKLTPQEVLSSLKQGNKEFVEGNLTVRNNLQRVKAAAEGQYPEAIILSCMDSRVPVEDVFHRGIGDLFVTRIAGNIVNEDILGGLEYACKVSGSKLIVVLGHEYCGALKSAIKDKNMKLGNITSLLSKIRPAVDAVEKRYEGEGDKGVGNPKFVEAVCEENVNRSISEIREKSPILKEMEDKGEIMIVGGVYDMESGKVTFL